MNTFGLLLSKQVSVTVRPAHSARLSAAKTLALRTGTGTGAIHAATGTVPGRGQEPGARENIFFVEAGGESTAEEMAVQVAKESVIQGAAFQSTKGKKVSTVLASETGQAEEAANFAA